jgi:YidC/Oxa1 family membrane protein insertase
MKMMELYKQEKINPLGGCLPILVQIPVFIALYWVLLSAVELRHAPWIGWIQDLSAPDPWYILPVVYAITAWLQVKLSPTPITDPVQAKVFQIMPIAFSVLFVFFPSGLVLYWLVNNVLQIAQQWQVNRMLEKEQALALAKRRQDNREGVAVGPTKAAGDCWPSRGAGRRPSSASGTAGPSTR